MEKFKLLHKLLHRLNPVCVNLREETDVASHQLSDSVVTII